MFFPEIPASKLAGFIGLHKFQDQNEVFYDMLMKDKEVKAQIQDIEKTHGRRSFYSVVSEVFKDTAIMDCVSSGIAAAQKTTDVSSVLADVEDKARVVLNLRRDTYTPELRNRLAEEVRGRVSKQRGIYNENTILNNYEAEREVKVVERNTRTIKKAYENFAIVGRIDGYVASENRIVDSKDRTKFWPAVPLYDEIQLRCYMDMTGADESELIERFPDGRTRTTKFTNDADKWKSLHDLVDKNVVKLSAIVENADELKRVVFANTVCINQNGGADAIGPSPRVQKSAATANV
jgi:hypothetical protein